MTFDQLALVFFGIPLAVMALGLRRSLGPRGIVLVLIAALIVTVYAGFLETSLRRIGADLPVPAREFVSAPADPGRRGAVSRMGLLHLSGALLGSLSGVLIRFRGEGSRG